MSLKARIKEVDGKFVIVAGPSADIKREFPTDHVVPCSQVYEQDFDLLFPTHIGPTCTVEDLSNGKKYVKMLYTPVESDIYSVKMRMIEQFGEIFELIDMKSTRAVRAIIYAEMQSNDPDLDDINVATKCEEAAIRNRMIIAQINAAEDLRWLYDNQGELRPYNPWEVGDYFHESPMPEGEVEEPEEHEAPEEA